MKPDWIRVRYPAGASFKQVDETLARRSLHTVCDQARCPNKGECWALGTATFMILGDICTRGCRFCAVATGKNGSPVRPDEGDRLAAAVAELKLDYVVLTSVDRDDLRDRGAGHFARCIYALRERCRAVKIEALIPDYFGGELETVLDAAPDVIAHNVETVRSLQSAARDARASFDKSLRTLIEAKSRFKENTGGKTKTSLMLGLGETHKEILSCMDELRSANVDILVIGQYLQPSKQQLPVSRYITPEEFERYRDTALKKGFASVISEPLARTSYHAKKTYSES
ncbi:MAG: lipoyl synthase [Treponema sp.]|jgi:lipoic acid synthetase|nr:lipoyl synthase [Treponema sp.]